MIVNIGNARLYGLEDDLGMPPDSNQYQLAVGILFVTYCVCGIPYFNTKPNTDQTTAIRDVSNLHCINTRCSS